MLDFDDADTSLDSDSIAVARRAVTKKVFPVSSSLDPISIGNKRPDANDVKVVGGRGYDLRQPIPIKYGSVRQRFLDARQNFWVPNDIPMGEDKSQWLTGN